MPGVAERSGRLHCAPVPYETAVPAPEPPLDVLLIGASSQIGRAALADIGGAGHRVQALSRRPAPLACAGARWHRADLSAGWPAAVTAPVDVVLSFGPLQALADALAGLGWAPCRRLVATSSMSAVSKSDSPVPDDRALADALQRAEESLARQCERLGIGWTLLRPTMIYGLGLDRNLTPIARRAMRWRVFPYPRGSGLRQPVHAADVAQAAWRAAQSPAAVGQTFEIGGGERIRIDAMFRRVRRSLPAWTLPLPVPRAALAAAARLWPALRGPVSRIDQDLVADNGPVGESLGVHPRPFAPDADAWREGGAR